MTFDDLELSVRLRDVLKRVPYNMATLLTHTPYTLCMMLRERREQAYYARRQVITINELEGMEKEALEDLEAIRGALEKKGLSSMTTIHVIELETTSSPRHSGSIFQSLLLHSTRWW